LKSVLEQLFLFMNKCFFLHYLLLFTKANFSTWTNKCWKKMVRRNRIRCSARSKKHDYSRL